MQITITISDDKFDEVSEQIAQLKRVSGSSASDDLKQLLTKEGANAIELAAEQMNEVFGQELEQRNSYEKEQRQRLSSWLGAEDEK